MTRRGFAAAQAAYDRAEPEDPVEECSGCGGEGYYQAHRGDPGPTRCRHCDGRGVVPVEEPPTVEPEVDG